MRVIKAYFKGRQEGELRQLKEVSFNSQIESIFDEMCLRSSQDFLAHWTAVGFHAPKTTNFVASFHLLFCLLTSRIIIFTVRRGVIYSFDYRTFLVLFRW